MYRGHGPVVSRRGFCLCCLGGTAFAATNGFALLYWQAGPPGGPAVVTGTDVAKFEHGRIETLYVFVDQTPR